MEDIPVEYVYIPVKLVACFDIWCSKEKW